MSTPTLQRVTSLAESDSVISIILFVVLALAFLGVCVALLVPRRRQQHSRPGGPTSHTSSSGGYTAGAWSFDAGGSTSGSDGGSGGDGGGGGGGCD
jgi:hypothetical protein